MSIFNNQQLKLERQIAALESKKSKASLNYAMWGTQENKSKVFALQGKINNLKNQLEKMKHFQFLAQ